MPARAPAGYGPAMAARPELDHLILGVPDLEAAMDEFERRFGIRPVPGGSHPGQGTRNALVGLGPGRYLELLAPDPEQASGGPLLELVRRGPRLVGWCARTSALDECVAQARERGYDPGDPRRGERRTREGALLTWRFTAVPPPVGDGVVPFLIDWGETPHPSEALPTFGSLRALRAEHPRPDDVRPALAALGIELPLAAGPQPALIAVIATASGTVELR